MLMFWIVTPCGLSPEDGDSIFLRNGGIYLRVYTASQSRRTIQTHIICDYNMKHPMPYWTGSFLITMKREAKYRIRTAGVCVCV
jgi:hypothetical protein